MKDEQYFIPGDLVKVKHAIANVPVMVVKAIDRVRVQSETDKSVLLGITCYWFDTNSVLQVDRFNTKDLEVVPVRDYISYLRTAKTLIHDKDIPGAQALLEKVNSRGYTNNDILSTKEYLKREIGQMT